MKKLGWLALFGSQVAIVIGFWAYDHINHVMGNQLTGGPVGQYLAYGRLAGLLAVLFILFQIMLIGRVKWLERIFGMDRMAHLHHIIGFAIVVFLLAHPLLVTLGHSMQSESGFLEQYLDFLKNWEDVLAAAIGMLIISVTIIFSILVLKRWVKYEIWYYAHLTLYVGIALAFGHQFEVGSDFTGNKHFADYWYAIYAITFASLAYYRLLRPAIFFLRHRFKVAKVIRESADVTSIYIEGNRLEYFPAEAGQFMIVRFWAKGFRWEAHPFSISMCPDGKQLRLSIKASGDFTRKIPELEVGTPVFIDGPHGIFTSRNCRTSKVLLVAGGIGITPIRSLAEEMSAQKRDVTLIYANKNRVSIVFEKELDDLVKASEGRLNVIHILSQDESWSGEKGRLDMGKIRRLVPDFLERDIYLCGPPLMMNLILKTFKEIKAKKLGIHYEKFAL